ncbi:MAG TPA: carbohydrate kinase [Acidobacteriaceae bacterium]|nr:carbohydrate kinase [Acidobacteriaceae bacterium]
MPTESNSFRVAAIGELLWDLLPDGARLGGTVANFCAMTAALQDEAFLVSSVGEDERGRLALAQLAENGVRLDYVSLDSDHPTGTVAVTLASNTGPQYCIQPETAWDFIPETSALMALAPTLDAVCFGTLAQRSPGTRTTLRNFVNRTRPDCLRVFDVNLRAPFWTLEMLAWGCSRAGILKMNDEEVIPVAQAMGAPETLQDPVEVARLLLGRYSMRMVAITRGGKGSLLVTRDLVQEHPGVPCTVVDTIGAGDAFTAALTHAALRRLPLAEMADAANRWGAWVASQPGGMPHVTSDVRRQTNPAAM